MTSSAIRAAAVEGLFEVWLESECEAMTIQLTPSGPGRGPVAGSV